MGVNGIHLPLPSDPVLMRNGSRDLSAPKEWHDRFFILQQQLDQANHSDRKKLHLTFLYFQISLGLTFPLTIIG